MHALTQGEAASEQNRCQRVAHPYNPSDSFDFIAPRLPARLPAMKSLAALLALLLLVRTAEAGQFEDGIAAYEAKDYERAMQLLLPLADAGDAEAQYRVGNLYYFGYGVDQDQQIGTDWYERAAKQDHREATFNLGVAYYAGAGREEALDLAFALVQRAAVKCLPAAQGALAAMYWNGKGTAIDRVLAYAWLTYGYLLGDRESETLLALAATVLSKEELQRSGQLLAELQHDLRCETAR